MLGFSKEVNLTVLCDKGLIGWMDGLIASFFLD